MGLLNLVTYMEVNNGFIVQKISCIYVINIFTSLRTFFLSLKTQKLHHR